MPSYGGWLACNHVGEIESLEGGEAETRRRRIYSIAHVRLEFSRLYRLQPIREDVAVRLAGAVSRQ